MKWYAIILLMLFVKSSVMIPFACQVVKSVSMEMVSNDGDIHSKCCKATSHSDCDSDSDSESSQSDDSKMCKCPHISPFQLISGTFCLNAPKVESEGKVLLYQSPDSHLYTYKIFQPPQFV